MGLVGSVILRFSYESLFVEVAIKTECGSDAVIVHGLEADAIDQAQFLASGCQHGFHSGVVALSGNPIDLKERRNVLVKGSDHGKASAVLKQGDGFEQYVVIRQKWYLVVEQLNPSFFGGLMVEIALVEDRVNGGGVGEDQFLPFKSAWKASAR